MTQLDAYQLSALMMREAVKDKSYRAYPLGGEAGAYLRWKRGVITDATYRDYECCLDKLAREFPDLELSDFEPPVGTERLEEFLDRQWGGRAPRTYNKNLSIVKDFFKWAALKRKLHGDPSLPINPHKKRDVLREIIRGDDVSAILASGPHPEHVRRDRILLHLMLKYGIRKGAVRNMQFKHFDASRKRLTIFTKGEKIRELPIVDAALWDDLAKLQFEIDAKPDDFLLHRTKQIWCGYADDGSSKFMFKAYPGIQMSDHAVHDWWYGCMQRSGLVAKGVTSGLNMHRARRTAGQRVLDQTGNLKAVQMLLGHVDISTTANIYTDWDADQLAETMRGLEDV